MNPSRRYKRSLHIKQSSFKQKNCLQFFIGHKIWGIVYGSSWETCFWYKSVPIFDWQLFKIAMPVVKVTCLQNSALKTSLHSSSVRQRNNSSSLTWIPSNVLLTWLDFVTKSKSCSDLHFFWELKNLAPFGWTQPLFKLTNSMFDRPRCCIFIYKIVFSPEKVNMIQLEEIPLFISLYSIWPTVHIYFMRKVKNL